MSRSPALAFVVPAYNAAATLADTLGSIVRQTMADLEVLVVDDGSRDDPGAVVGSLRDPRVRVWRQANRGLAGARNAGYARTSAPVLCFLDADDLVVPGFAGRMLERLGAADAVACAYRFVDERGRDLRWVLRPSDHDLTPERLIGGNSLGVGGVLLRRNAAERILMGDGPFDDSLRVVEDWDLWLRMAHAGAVWARIEPKPLFLCRLRPGSLSRGLDQMWRTGLIVLRRAGASPSHIRRWHLRILAQAVAAAEDHLISDVFRDLAPVREDDAGVLCGALHAAFCRQNRVSPDDAGGFQDQWRDRVRDHFPDRPWAEILAARTTWGPDRWGRVARAAAAELGPGDTLVVYGAGMNGRAILSALDRAGVRALVIDDHPGAAPDRPQTTVDRLTSRHVVLVTPEERGEILTKLSAARAERVLVPYARDGLPFLAPTRPGRRRPTPTRRDRQRDRHEIRCRRLARGAGRSVHAPYAKAPGAERGRGLPEPVLVGIAGQEHLGVRRKFPGPRDGKAELARPRQGIVRDPRDGHA